MPIYRLLQGRAFEPEQIEVMAVAFQRALVELKLVDRADPLTELVARKVIEFAQRGEHDPVNLCARTVEAFKHDAA